MYLVTGGAGFIGSNIIGALVKSGRRVKVLDNFSTGKRSNLADFADSIEIVEGDLADPDTCRAAVKGVKYVLHQGALGSVPRSVEDPIRTHKSNADGTLNILVAARDAGVKRVVNAGSSSVYGNTPVLPKTESMPPTPLSPYAITKLIQEQYSQVFFKLYGLETVTLRYFNVYGPRQDPNSTYAAVIPRFISAASEKQPMEIYGDGRQTRDFTYVDDVVKANLLALESPDAVGKVYNVSGGKRIAILDLAHIVSRLMGKEISLRFLDPRAGDVRDSLADLSSIKRDLGYEPAINIEDGLRETIRWFLKAK